MTEEYCVSVYNDAKAVSIVALQMRLSSKCCCPLCVKCCKDDWSQSFTLCPRRLVVSCSALRYNVLNISLVNIGSRSLVKPGRRLASRSGDTGLKPLDLDPLMTWICSAGSQDRYVPGRQRNQTILIDCWLITLQFCFPHYSVLSSGYYYYYCCCCCCCCCRRRRRCCCFVFYFVHHRKDYELENWS